MAIAGGDIDPLRNNAQPGKYGEARRDAFTEKFGAPPERIFGPFLSDLATLEQRIAKGSML